MEIVTAIFSIISQSATAYGQLKSSGVLDDIKKDVPTIFTAGKAFLEELKKLKPQHIAAATAALSAPQVKP